MGKLDFMGKLGWMEVPVIHLDDEQIRAVSGCPFGTKYIPAGIRG